jgi:hypothetical protein
MEDVAMTVTEEMTRAAHEAAAGVCTFDGDLRALLSAALEAAEAVRPVPALPTWTYELASKLYDAYMLDNEGGDQYAQLYRGGLRVFGSVAPSAPPVPDTRPLQVTADEWQEYIHIDMPHPPLAALNSILARRQSPSADNVFGDAGNDFFAQQHMLSQSAAPVVEPGGLSELRMQVSDLVERVVALEAVEQRVERIEAACRALHGWWKPDALAGSYEAAINALAAVGKEPDRG